MTQATGCIWLGRAAKGALWLGILAALAGGCVNQSIAARRSQIPWNQPQRSNAAASLPFSLTEQYDE